MPVFFVAHISAEVLTYLLGDRLAHRDNAEELFDITSRSFRSFREAAEEAAISRLYGGIHYRYAVVNGQVQGRAVGEYIPGKLRGGRAAASLTAGCCCRGRADDPALSFY